MAKPSIAIASTTKRRFTISGRRWGMLATLCFLAAAYYLCYEHFPVHVTKDTPLYRATRNGKQGIVATGGRIVVPFEWDAIRPFDDNGMAICVTGSYQRAHRSKSNPDPTPAYYPSRGTGVIDNSGRQVIPATLEISSAGFDDQGEFHGVCDGQFITFDRSGREKRRSNWLPVDAYWFDQTGLIAVHQGEETGWMDRTGRIVLKTPAGIRAASDFHPSGLARVRNTEGLVGCMNDAGDIVVPASWEEIYTESGAILRGESFNNQAYETEFLQVSRAPTHGGNGLRGLISMDGRCVIPAEYHSLDVHRHENLVIARRGDGKCGTFDLSGKLVLPFEYEDIHFCKGIGLLEVKQHGKFGFVNSAGMMVIPFRYDGFSKLDAPIGSHLCYLSKDGKWGAIDSLGNVVVPFEFSSIVPLTSSEYFVGRIDNHNVIFDARGRTVGQPTHLDLYRIGSDARWPSARGSGIPDPSKVRLFEAIHHDTGGASGVFHIDRGLVVPLIHKNVFLNESGLLGKGLVGESSSWGRFVSATRAKLHELLPSTVPSAKDVEIIYNYDGNVVWRSDAKILDYIKAFMMLCWGLYCLRKYRIARRKQRMMLAA